MYSFIFIIALINSFTLLPISLIGFILQKALKTSSVKNEQRWKKFLIAALIVHFTFGALFVYNTIDSSFVSQPCSQQKAFMKDLQKSTSLPGPLPNAQDTCGVFSKDIPFSEKLRNNFRPAEMIYLLLFGPLLIFFQGVYR